MTHKIRMGALLGPVPNGAPANFLVEQAKTYVAEGFNSLWAAQSMGRGFMWTDPFVTMTIAATVSQDVEVGSAIVQIPLYHPGDFAHRVVSLHQLLGDRLILGLGAGSTGADFALVGRDGETRFKVFTESVAALREAYVPGSDANKALSPWPHMTTPPKLFFGTWGKGVERAVKEFDGWIASGHYRTVDELEETAARYQEAGGGRAIVSTLMIDGDTDLGEFREKLARFAEAGFNDAVVLIQPGGPAPDVVRALTD
jgi:alkanesulfonate monooxygenase SsuD/methylene tetrahydromethanopterin reductase-like flavin-dependent oxidoreductase (luciferase family)